jgi:hypothetical protein
MKDTVHMVNVIFTPLPSTRSLSRPIVAFSSIFMLSMSGINLDDSIANLFAEPGLRKVIKAPVITKAKIIAMLVFASLLTYSFYN